MIAFFVATSDTFLGNEQKITLFKANVYQSHLKSLLPVLYGFQSREMVEQLSINGLFHETDI